MRHEKNRRMDSSERALEPLDRLNIEMVGRLVQKKQIRLLQKRLLQLATLELTAGKTFFRGGDLLSYIHDPASLFAYDLPDIRFDDTSEDFQKRGLPFAVPADDATAFALLYRKRDGIKNRRTAERNRHFTQTD